MKTLKYLFFLTLFALTACNGSSSSSAPDPEASALTAQVLHLTQALADATHVQAQQASKISELRLVGTIPTTSGSASIRFESEPRAIPSFGSCSDMGVMVGFTNGSGTPADALSASVQDFKQCTGYLYGANVADGSITQGVRIAYDGPNCTGNVFVWEESGAGYSTATLQNGVVFMSPADSLTYMVTAGQTPQPVQQQSEWILASGGCQPIIQTELMYRAVINDATLSGVPSEGVGKFQLGSP